MAFFQKAPVLSNLYLDDKALQTEVYRRTDPVTLDKYLNLFEKVGHLAAGELQEWLKEAESAPPRHVPYDAWGNRIDQIETSAAWERFREFSARTGFVSVGYDADLKTQNRVIQTALLYLFSASSATYSCPLAMTDAAARVLIDIAPHSLRDRLVPRLLSREPALFMTSGQWMTERIGGSDVSNTETVAQFHSVSGGNEQFTLHGTKWFTSATTAEMALTLARIVDEKGHGVAGSSGLTLFCVELDRSDKGIEGITVNRLKDKLGTRALPTAELTLDGVLATRIGPIGRGVASISGMLNITRYYNAVASASSMGLSTAMVKAYAKTRRAFDRPIEDHILHQKIIDELESGAAAALALCFEVAELLGKTEAKAASDEEGIRLRALVPLAKLLLGKEAVAHASETLECFGGAGYVEDTGLPRLLRDAQVLPIWEGTTNVLSLDLLRAERKQRALSCLLSSMSVRAAQLLDYGDEAKEVQDLLRHVIKRFQATSSEIEMEGITRKLAMTSGLLLQAILLAEAIQHAVNDDKRALLRFTTFVENHLRIF